MHSIINKELKVFGPRKCWTIAIGNHHNILISYHRYPLIGYLDLGDLSAGDFQNLAGFFREKIANSWFTTSDKKWTFTLDSFYNLTITFKHYPFVGYVELGEVSKENCEQLTNMFIKAGKI